MRLMFNLLKDKPYFVGLILWWIVFIIVSVVIGLFFRLVKGVAKRRNKDKKLKYGVLYRLLLKRLSFKKEDKNDFKNNRN